MPRLIKASAVITAESTYGMIQWFNHAWSINNSNSLTLLIILSMRIRLVSLASSLDNFLFDVTLGGWISLQLFVANIVSICW